MCLINVCKIKIIQKKLFFEEFKKEGLEGWRETEKRRTRKDGGRVGRRKQDRNGRNKTRVLRHRASQKMAINKTLGSIGTGI